MMLVKADNWIIAQFDRAGIWAQRKGWRMTELHVHMAGLTVASTVTFCVLNSRLGWVFAAFNLLVWGGHFAVCLRDANKYRDYPESAKMLQTLNARALGEREKSFVLRWLLVGLWIPFIPLDIAGYILGLEGRATLTLLVFSQLTYTSPIALFYIYCCSFIGPGEFAKQKQESASGQEIFERGS